MLSVILSVLASLLLIPYVGWGVYVLRRQLIHHDELPRPVQWATLLGVLGFHIIELMVIRVPMGSESGLYLLTTLALVMSTTALYGHLFVSMFSQLIVDLIHPSTDHPVDHADFSAAEALEEVGDYQGALNEYTVMARMFPRDPEPILKVAETHLELDQIEEAIRFFEMGLKKVEEPQRALGVTNRLFGIYNGIQQSKDDARDVLKRYLERFPDSEFSESVQNRLERLDTKPIAKPFKSVTDLLEPPSSDLLG